MSRIFWLNYHFLKWQKHFGWLTSAATTTLLSLLSLLRCCKLQLVKHKVKTRCDNMLCKHYKKLKAYFAWHPVQVFMQVWREYLQFTFLLGGKAYYLGIRLGHVLLIPWERLCVSLWRIMVSGNCAKFLMRLSNVSFSQPGRRCYITFGVSWIFLVFMRALYILWEKSLGYWQWWW